MRSDPHLSGLVLTFGHHQSDIDAVLSMDSCNDSFNSGKSA